MVIIIRRIYDIMQLYNYAYVSGVAKYTIQNHTKYENINRYF